MKTITLVIALLLLLTPATALAQTHMPIIETISQNTNTCVDLLGYSTPVAQQIFTPFVMNGRPLTGPQCRRENTGAYVGGISLATGDDKQIILRSDALLLTTKLNADKLSYPLNAHVDLQDLANTPMPPDAKNFQIIGVWLLDTEQLESVSAAQVLPESPVDWRLWRETQMLSEANEIIKERFPVGLSVPLSVRNDDRYNSYSRYSPHATLGQICPYMLRYETYVVNVLYIFPVVEPGPGGKPVFDMWAFVVDVDPEIAQECPNAPSYVFIRRDSLLQALPASIKQEADQRAMTKTRLWHTGLLYEPIGGGAPIPVNTNVSVVVIGSLIIVGGFAVINEETHVMLLVASP